MRLVLWFKDYVSFDKLGIALSAICAIHCMITPLLLLSLPMMGRYYLAHPFFHLIIALLIIPVGLYAFLSGFKHHRNIKVLLIGIPGLLIVSVAPLLVHQFYFSLNEPLIVSMGSLLLISAHWINRRSCSCSVHHH